MLETETTELTTEQLNEETSEKDTATIRLFNRLYDLLKCVFLLSVLVFVFLKDQGDMVSFIVSIVAGVIFAIVTKYWLTPKILENKKIPPLWQAGIIIGIAVVVIAGSTMLIRGADAKISSLCLILVSGVYVITYRIVRLVKQYKESGKFLKKEEDDDDDSYSKFREWLSKSSMAKIVMAVIVGLIIVIPTVFIMAKDGIFEGVVFGVIMLIVEMLLIHI